MKPFEPGTKVKYLYLGKWQTGVIHAYRQYENEAGLIKGVSYLIDTGRNERVDEVHFDHRDRELNRQVKEHMHRHGSTDVQAVEAVLKKNDLPANKLDVELVRQPEQIELPQEFVKSL